MKNVLLFLLCFLIFTSVYSQKCEVSKDPFTNETVVSYDFHKKTVYYELKQGAATLEILFAYSGGLKSIIPQGSEIMFKTDKGDIVKQVTLLDSYPKTTVTTQAVYSNYSLKIALSKEDLQKLAASKLDVIRYPDPKGGQTDYDVKGMGKITANQIYKGATCLLGNL